MARGPLTFKQRDLTAALKAARDAGHKISRVRITLNSVELFIANDDAPDIEIESDDAPETGEKNDFEGAV